MFSGPYSCRIRRCKSDGDRSHGLQEEKNPVKQNLFDVANDCIQN